MKIGVGEVWGIGAKLMQGWEKGSIFEGCDWYLAGRVVLGRLAGHSAAEAVRGRKFNSGPLAGVERLILGWSDAYAELEIRCIPSGRRMNESTLWLTASARTPHRQRQGRCDYAWGP